MVTPEQVVMTKEQYEMLWEFRSYVENVIRARDSQNVPRKDTIAELMKEFPGNQAWVYQIIAEYDKGVRLTDDN